MGDHIFTFSTEQFLRRQRKQARGTDLPGNKTSLLTKEVARFYLQWTNGAPNQSLLSCHRDSTSGVPPGHLLYLGKTKCETLANSTWTIVKKKLSGLCSEHLLY